MTNSIPDIMGEYVSETKRYLANGVQYQGYFEPHAVAPGQLTTLHIFLQNTLDVPVQIFGQIDLPKTGGFFGGGKPILQTETTTVQLELGPIEAGLVTMPALVGEATKAGDYSLTLTLKTKPNGKGKRLRPAEAQSHSQSARKPPPAISW